MARPRGRKPVPDAEIEEILAGAAISLPRLCELIRRTNPTRLPLSEAERARRYALKCRLQAELILRFGEELAPTPCADGVVALSCRSGRGDGGHAKLERLPPEARDWLVARLGLRE